MKDFQPIQTKTRPASFSPKGITRRVIIPVGAPDEAQTYRTTLRMSRAGSLVVGYEKFLSGREVIFQVSHISGECMTLRFWDARGEVTMSEWYYRAYLKSLTIKTVTANLCQFPGGRSAAPVMTAEEEMTQYIPIDQMREAGLLDDSEEMDPAFTLVLELPDEEEEEEFLPLPDMTLEEEQMFEEELPLPVVSIYDYMTGRADEDGGYLILPEDEPALTRKAMG